MSALSLSIFTIEADLKPVLAFAAKKHEEADAFFRDERVRSKLKAVSSGGVALCDDYSILRIRLSNADERASATVTKQRHLQSATTRLSFSSIWTLLGHNFLRYPLAFVGTTLRGRRVLRAYPDLHIRRLAELGLRRRNESLFEKAATAPATVFIFKRREMKKR